MPKRMLAAGLLAVLMAFGATASAADDGNGGAASAPAAPKAKKKAKGKAASGEESTVRVPRVLREIARCESGGDPRAISPDGQYRGKYQFSRPTWRSVGGSGDPAAASEAEQDRRAIKLYKAEGTAPWPSCG